MALTRSSLKAMGIDADKIDEIINGHTESINALKDEKDQLKEKLEAAEKKAASLEGLQKELDEAKKDSWKVKYDAIKDEYEKYKTTIAGEKTAAQKKDLYTALLKEAGVSEKRIPAILKVTNLEGITIEDGKIKGSDDVKKTIVSEWADFIGTPGSSGSNPANPPAQSGGKSADDMTDAEYFKSVEAAKKK